MKSVDPNCQRGQESSGFTRAELVVVIAMLAMLALTALTSLAKTQPNFKAALCRHNLKQLAAAWLMYPEDNRGSLVPNFGGGYVPTGTGQAGWATGWLDWSLATANTNVLFLVDARYAALAPYLKGATNLFKCPADDYLSPTQQARGWRQRARSYSINAYVGENQVIGQTPTTSGDYAMYKQIKKLSEFRFPSPAEVVLVMDEHPDSINDPVFWSPSPRNNWPDIPATYHDGAAGIAFADGHTAEQKWKGALTTGTPVRVRFYSYNNFGVTSDDPDTAWMSYHTPRVSSQSY